MKNRLILMILRGQINADDAAIVLDEKGFEVDTEIYDELRMAEAQYLASSAKIQVDDTVLVKGSNGQPNYTANYRGKSGDNACIIPLGGMQIMVPYSSIQKL